MLLTVYKGPSVTTAEKLHAEIKELHDTEHMYEVDGVFVELSKVTLHRPHRRICKDYRVTIEGTMVL